MVTISQVVKRIIDARPTLQESLIEGIVNYASLAEKLTPHIESELGMEANKSAVLMALRRHAENLRKKSIIKKTFAFSPEIIMKTNLCDVCILKTPSALAKIRQIHKIVDYEKDDTLNVIQGNYEIAMVISQKHLGQLIEILEGEKILNTEKNLVSLTLRITEEFFYTPGILSLATRRLAWENINIFENISTMTEIIYIIAEKDAMRAYSTFREMVMEFLKEEQKNAAAGI